MSLLQDKITVVGTFEKKQKRNSSRIFAEQTKADIFINVWLSKACYFGFLYTEKEQISCFTFHYALQCCS